MPVSEAVSEPEAPRQPEATPVAVPEADPGPQQPAPTETATVTEAARRAAFLINQAHAANTKRGYAASWRRFEAWCAGHGHAALPASPETVALYLAERSFDLRPATVAADLAAIRHVHRRHGTPLADPQWLIRDLLRGHRRVAGTAQDRKSALTPALLAAIVARQPATLLGLRDTAILLVGFAGALRRSEIADLQRADVHPVPGGYRLRIRAGKTDPGRRGAWVLIPRIEASPICPAAALGRWLQVTRLRGGPLFRQLSGTRVVRAGISGRLVARVVKRAVEKAGIDATAFSGHSLRAGYATAASRAGMNRFEIAERTRHRSQAALARYIEGPTEAVERAIYTAPRR